MNLNMEDPYLKYYTQQAGAGISNVYRGAAFQRGHGIGSFLGGLFRSVTPLIRSGIKAIGKEAMKSGVGFLDDMVYSVPIKDAFKKRAKEFTGGIKRKADDGIDDLMSGSGYKKRRKTVTVQSIAKLLATKTSKRKPKKSAKKNSKVKKKKKKTASKKKNRKNTLQDIFH